MNYANGAGGVRVRVYVEKDGEAVRKLYITSIHSQDAGSYICSGVVARQRLEKRVTMMLFSAYLLPCLLSTVSVVHTELSTRCVTVCHDDNFSTK